MTSSQNRQHPSIQECLGSAWIDAAIRMMGAFLVRRGAKKMRLILSLMRSHAAFFHGRQSSRLHGTP